MPRPPKQIPLPPGAANKTVNCFAFKHDATGRGACVALKDTYCLRSNKPCGFYATPEEAMEGRRKAEARLRGFGTLEEYHEKYGVQSRL